MIDAKRLLGWFEPEDGAWMFHRGRLIATKGSASTVVVPPGPDLALRVADAARGLLSNHRGPLVFAIPFDERSQAIVSAPEEATVLANPKLPVVDTRGRASLPLRYEPFPSPQRYEEMVSEALKMIEVGDLDKIVLARMLIAHSSVPFDRKRLLEHLAVSEPDAAVFALNGFIGASPELLVSKHGNQLRARPLAGTSRREEDPDGSRLLAGPKEAEEHRIVAQAVSGTLQEMCTSLTVDGPSLVATSTMWHLATEMTGTAASGIDVMDLVTALHPTPAVCGLPREAARKTIREIEGFDRMIYAGAVGWMDESGDGEWFVALRCAEVRGRMAMLFAGAGIVAGSDPSAELAETSAKFLPMQRALGSHQLPDEA